MVLRRSSAASRSTPIAVAAVIVSAVILAGCSHDAPARPVAPADLVLDATDLPDGFSPTPLSVPDLVAGNKPNLDEFARASIEPSFCRPTADAALNAHLTAADAAVLAARSSSGSLVQVVSTAQRDITADIATTTGRCARTRTVMGPGTLAGTRIDTEYSMLGTPDAARNSAVQEVLLTRSDSRTTLPDGGVSNQVGYAGYASVRVPTGGTYTVQLTVSGTATPASNPPTDATAPMSDAEFVALFGTALRAATR